MKRKPTTAQEQEAIMGEAREAMDRLTEAFTSRDLKAVGECYAENAVVVSPERGEITGRDQIVDYWRPFMEAFPDIDYELLYQHESGNTAIDEGYFTGTNSAPLPLPSGETLPATGKSIRIRGCDIATVENDLIAEHRLYYDQMEFLGQLGLLPEELSSPSQSAT
jgi:ketosteroid isomerase-like protein